MRTRNHRIGSAEAARIDCLARCGRRVGLDGGLAAGVTDLVAVMGDPYPELREHQALIEQLADTPTPTGLTPREMETLPVGETTVIPVKTVRRNERKTHGE